MKYVDLHCDTLTECAKLGSDLSSCPLQTSLEKLKKSGCKAQCFAIYTQGYGAANDFSRYLQYYFDMLEKHKNAVLQIKCGADFLRAEESGKLGSILTVENLGFIGEDLSKLKTLKEAGVKMASLVWNYENSLGFPNLIFKNDYPQFELRENRGLKPLGRETVEALDELGILIDISHLSDGGALDILQNRKTPIVASHSNAAEVYNVSRNLTDGLIKKIADCGGVIGVNFCKDFLGKGATFALVLEHIKHIIKVGGEDVIALGSDFDGIPAPPDMPDCTYYPAIFDYLLKGGIAAGVLEKLTHANAERVFKNV